MATVPTSTPSPPYQNTVRMATTPRNSTVGIEEGEGQDGVLVGLHVQAIELGELVAGLALAVEELHDAHAGDVLLQEGVDAGDGGADAAVGVAHAIAEHPRGKEDQRHHGKGGQRQAPVHLQHDEDEEDEQEGVVDHGGDAGGEQVIERVDVGGDAGDQAADRAAVVEAHGQLLQMGEDFLAQVVHGFLRDLLHDANLDVLEEKAQAERGHQQKRHPADAAYGGVQGELVAQRGDDVAIDGDLEELRADGGERGDGQGQEAWPATTQPLYGRR